MALEVVAACANAFLFVVPCIVAGSLLSVVFSKTVSKEREVMGVKDVRFKSVELLVAITIFYLLIKLLLKKYLDIVVLVYSSVISWISLSQTISSLTLFALGQKVVDSYTLLSAKFSSGKGKEILSFKFGTLDILNWGITSLFVLAYNYTKHWMLNNVIGWAITFSVLLFLSIDSTKTALLLLIPLVFYDAFLVFGTEVMMVVATSIDAPMKIIFPRNLIDYAKNMDISNNKMMLGLGDVLLPGLFITLCVNLDAMFFKKRSLSAKLKKDYISKRTESLNFSKPYFLSSLIGYLIGLGVALVITIRYNSGQPALVYLVPSVLMSTFGTALFRGELREFYSGSLEPLPESVERKERTPRKAKKA